MSQHPDAVRLARLYALRRHQGQAALSLDAYDRWGHGANYPGLEADQALAAGASETDAAMRALAATLDPEVRQAFVEARIALLERYLEHVAGDSTEAFVARGECEAWRGFGRGESQLVRQNTYYVRFDAAQFQELFGFDPLDLDALTS